MYRKPLNIVALIFSLATSLAAAPLAASETSGVAPDFTLKSKNGDNIRLADFKGKVVMINFWASWCGPCRQEMPALDQLYTRYQRGGFTVLGVNVETDSHAADNLLKKIPVTFPILYDSTSSVSELYQVQAMPTSLLIDRDGNLRHIYQGYKPGYEDKYRNDIKALIRE